MRIDDKRMGIGEISSSTDPGPPHICRASARGVAVLGEDGFAGRQRFVDVGRLGVESFQAQAGQVIGTADLVVMILFLLKRQFAYRSVLLGRKAWL
ncbi:hypothetical protein BK648_17055 [Pseudomonas poae]|uniref:Uncharacterized protein n=1 Tax=Pseudomonas poae TaxID=200451 RepID=A0A423EVJ4_9PSED|nr:hypothetical protein BK648_17055 [Pseudomonas poae]